MKDKRGIYSLITLILIFLLATFSAIYSAAYTVEHSDERLESGQTYHTYIQPGESSGQ